MTEVGHPELGIMFIFQTQPLKCKKQPLITESKKNVLNQNLASGMVQRLSLMWL